MLALNIVNVAATITTVVLLFSPSPDYRRIHTEKNTGEVRILPVLMLGINCFMWSVYGFLRGTIFPVMSLNAFGAFTCFVFSMVFYRWSSDRAALRKMAVATVAWVVLMIAFVVLCRTNVLSTSSNLQEKIIGYLAVAFNICLYAAPLQTMTLVLRTKSAASLPVMMCSVNLVNGSLWVLYGILANDMFVLTPNALGVALSVIQVALCIKYRPTGPALNVDTKGDVSATMSPVVEDEVAITFVKSPVYESVHSPATWSRRGVWAPGADEFGSKQFTHPKNMNEYKKVNKITRKQAPSGAEQQNSSTT
ncbi:hypothetical protein BBJ29_002735 [Phytophthora kernoviae]|uniref:Sugar transporter SWEET1 n=1 Tax=Phytophthora kernoviae TaxID=325452 RepID=A0A3F2RPK1_9STRA|nr:hypothetical protein BBJ29_002735 [Phytophthora kernoviae]RLN61744.1 hypothetical protein BBP00_00005204 [Phytophthora kernoviae]